MNLLKNIWLLHFWILLIVINICLNSCHRKSVRQKIVQQSQDTTIQGFNFVKVEKGPFLSGLNFEQKELNYSYFLMQNEVTNLQYYNYLKIQFTNHKIEIKNGKIYKKITGMPLIRDSTYLIKILNKAISFESDSFRLDSLLSNHPVIQINWIGCMDFCRFYGFSLPNRMEWEKAARGMNRFEFPWGNEIDSSYANYWNSKDPYETGTTPVGYYNGQKHGNFQTHNGQSPYGCFDMAGNAWEYLADYINCQGTGGAGGGFNYHTAAFVSINSSGCFGLPGILSVDRCDTSDGFRAVFKYE